MTTLWQVPAIAIFVWLSTPPGNLADAALQEALRRSLMPKSVLSFSIYDWPPAVLVPLEKRSEIRPSAVLVSPGESAGTTAIARPGGEPIRDEAWWRDRMARARASLARDETMAEAMQSHVNALRHDAENRDDPAQQALLRQRLKAVLAELERLEKQIGADRQAIADIEDEARRLGIPPGWIRGDAISSGRSPSVPSSVRRW